VKLSDFIIKCQKLAETIPDAEVLVDGWPVEICALPAYYDGPSKRYDEGTNTLIFISNGTKVMLHALDMDELDELHPGMRLDTSVLSDQRAAHYHDMLFKIRQT